VNLHSPLFCRGRDAGCPPPPSQIPACSIPAPGSSKTHLYALADRSCWPYRPCARACPTFQTNRQDSVNFVPLFCSFLRLWVEALHTVPSIASEPGFKTVTVTNCNTSRVNHAKNLGKMAFVTLVTVLHFFPGAPGGRKFFLFQVAQILIFGCLWLCLVAFGALANSQFPVLHFAFFILQNDSNLRHDHADV
jgi:hypothetical protein